MKIYKVNINGDFKVKREININDYIVWDCSGSSGITLKHKKNGKTIFLATKEFFDNCKDSYKNQLENIGKYFSYVYSDEISELKRKLWNIFPIAPECPSSIYKNPLVNDLLKRTEISFHKELITDKFKLHEVVRSIFKHCLE